MKVMFNHIAPEFRESIERECSRHVEKLNRWLKRYQPDLIQLQTSLDKQPRRTEYTVSLNLVLPSGTLHAEASAAGARASAKAAFAELEAQVKKHQSKLRKDYVWKRKRGREETTVRQSAPGE